MVEPPVIAWYPDHRGLFAASRREDLISYLESNGVSVKYYLWNGGELPLTGFVEVKRWLPGAPLLRGPWELYAEGIVDVRLVSPDKEALEKAVKETAKRTPAGLVRGNPLQAYHQTHYSYEILIQQCARALLTAKGCWARCQLRYRQHEDHPLAMAGMMSSDAQPSRTG